MTTSALHVDPDLRVLERSPLVNVVWQVKFTGLSDVSDGRIALAIQKSLPHATSLSRANNPQIQVQMSQPGSIASDSHFQSTGTDGWRLSSTDNSTHISLNSDSLSVETTAYAGWSSQFSHWIDAALDALATNAQPQVLLRVGMRYINAIFGSALQRDPFSEVAELTELANPALLGFLSDAKLAPAVEAIQSRQVLRLNSVTSHIQHATIRSDSGELGLLLDIDSYNEENQAFDIEIVRRLSDELHLSGLTVFQNCLNSTAWSSMGPVSDKGDK